MKTKSIILSLLPVLTLLLISYSCLKEEVKTPPEVTISAVTNITTISTLCEGEIITDGGSPVTERGFCWSTSNPTPLLTDSKINNGSGSGNFNNNITGLSPGVFYYLRAYATNSVGTSYSSQVTFKTAATDFAVTTSAVGAITSISAECGGTISSDGGSPVTARGVCWSTTANPTIANSKTIDGTGKGTFSRAITGLTAGTTYYVRAYATNSTSTVYGNEITFRTSDYLSIGLNYSGGIVAYIFKQGDIGYVQNEKHGIIAAPNDLPSKLTWGPYIDANLSLQLFSGLSENIGTGKQNTLLILQVASSTSSTYAAASACKQYNNGYNDWFLPSKNELIMLRNNLSSNSIGSFYTTLDPKVDAYSAQYATGYWSSSLMQNGVGALALFFSNTGECGCAKFESYWVRPIRYF